MLQAIEPSVSVKKEVTDVSDREPETPDSPSPTHSNERMSTIPLIPLERSENKIKTERDSHRKDDNRRRLDHQYSDRPTVDKYGNIRNDGVNRHRSRYDQHERSNSRDRYRSDRRERSDSSERSRHGKNDRNRFRQEDRDSRDRSWKSYDQRTKTERSDRYSPSSQRDSSSRPNKNVENDFRKTAFNNRVAARPSSTIVSNPTDDDDKFTMDEVSELTVRNNKMFGGDSDEEGSSEKNLMEVRSKLATQIKLAQLKKEKMAAASTFTSNEFSATEIGKLSLNAPIKKPLNSVPKENSSNFSFLKTFGQSNKTEDRLADAHRDSKSPINIDTDIINKIVAQPINQVIPSNLQDMNFVKVKQALETAAIQQRLALKYHPTKSRSDQNIPETNTQPHHHQPDPSNSNNLQLVCFNDPRVLGPARDPRVQQDLRMQPFSPPSTPPCISNYPPILQSSAGYKQNSYAKPPNHFLQHQSAYHNTKTSHLATQSNLISITPHAPPTYNNQNRGTPNQSPVSSSVSPPPRYQYQPPSFPERNRNSSGIHNKFRASINDNVERQKYEQSRRRSSDYHEREPHRETPKTYGEYKRSLQSNVSSTSEKLDRTSNESRAANISTSHHDKVYRSGNYATPIPSVTTQPTGSKFKIPKKSANETAAKVIHTPEICDSKDSDDDHLNARPVKDSDDSEHEISVNSRSIVISDCESDIRDPRMRVQALKKASSSNENKTKESAEKQNNVVTSSTSVIPDQVPTTENNEFLKHLTDPKNLLALMKLVNQISDDSTITKVKELLEAKAVESNETPAVSGEEDINNLSTSMRPDKVDVPKTPRKKSKNELEKLNEDIRTMFISDGVLNATGRRVCALYNNNAADAKETPAARITKPAKKQAKDDVAIEKKSE